MRCPHARAVLTWPARALAAHLRAGIMQRLCQHIASVPSHVQGRTLKARAQAAHVYACLRWCIGA
eukprot:11702399-Alexandrium_andersonii.AAC.1